MNSEFNTASKTGVTAFGIYLILLNITLIYILARIWPGTVPVSDAPGMVIIIPGLLSLSLWPETRYLMIVAVSGALGSYIHMATSFADYVGNRQIVSSWSWWYLLRPFISIAFALVAYFILRGGLVAGTNGASTLSPYGVAGISAIAGMFSRQASDKLRELFETLFIAKVEVRRKDALESLVYEHDEFAGKFKQ